MGNTFYDYFSNEGKNTVFGLPYTEELTGRSAVFPEGSAIRFGDELAVKCDDDLFLPAAAGKTLLVEELPDESLKAMDAEKATADAADLPEELELWFLAASSAVAVPSFSSLIAAFASSSERPLLIK